MSSNIQRLRAAVKVVGPEWSVPVLLLWDATPQGGNKFGATPEALSAWEALCAFIQRIAPDAAFHPTLYLRTEQVERRWALPSLAQFIQHAAQVCESGDRILELSLRVPVHKVWSPSLGMVLHVHSKGVLELHRIQRPCLQGGSIISAGEE